MRYVHDKVDGWLVKYAASRVYGQALCLAMDVLRLAMFININIISIFIQEKFDKF